MNLGATRVSENAIMMTNRELRRVPLDFDWPIDKTWKGYINPHGGFATPCVCGGTGSSPKARFYHDQWYGDVSFSPLSTHSVPYTSATPEVLAFAERNVERSPNFYGATTRGTALWTLVVEREAQRLAEHFNRAWMHHLSQDDVDALVDGDRLWDFTRRPRTPEQEELLKKQADEGGSPYWLAEPNGYRPTANEINRWSLHGFGHDSINAWVCIKARCAREGVDPTCSACRGKGRIWPSPESEEAYENWESFDPPTGEAYQLWETCSEGSPISPPFATLPELAEYAAVRCTISGSQRLSKAGWLHRFTSSDTEEQMKQGDGVTTDPEPFQTLQELPGEAELLGTGVLTWFQEERRTDRYGYVWLDQAGSISVSGTASPRHLSTVRQGVPGSLVAEIVETAESTHIGDLFRGFSPSTPEIGDIIVLGSDGTLDLTVDEVHGAPMVKAGLRPLDGRSIDWLNPKALYRCHEQVVRLWFIPG